MTATIKPKPPEVWGDFKPGTILRHQFTSYHNLLLVLGPVYNIDCNDSRLAVYNISKGYLDTNYARPLAPFNGLYSGKVTVEGYLDEDDSSNDNGTDNPTV